MTFPSMRMAAVALVPVVLFNVVESVRAQECVEPDCVPTPACESDDDCGDGMSCGTRSMLECPAELDRGCMDGESDDECVSRSQMIEEENCTTIEDHLCVPDWSIPCNADADCPEEFTCTGQGGTPCEPIDNVCG